MPPVQNWIKVFFNLKTEAESHQSTDSESRWQLPLKDAVSEASNFLAFASHSGIALEPEHMKSILEMSKLLDDVHGILTQGIEPEKEQRFWQAYSAVAAAIFPVNSESINATMDNCTDQTGGFWKKRPIAQKAVVKYAIFSMLVLMAIIYFQSYLQMGITIRGQLQSTFHNQKQSINELFLAKIAEEDGRLKSSGRADNQNYAKKLYEKYKVELQSARVTASRDELFAWRKEGGKFFTEFEKSPDIKYQEIPLDILDSPSTASDQANIEPSQLGPNKSVIEPNKTPQARQSYDYSLLTAQLKSVVIPTYIALNKSEQILRLVSEFVLPLLYGLLGACAYILRDINRAIGSVTFAKATIIKYRLRLIMGPLVGIAVGLVLSQSPSDFPNNPEGNSALPAGTTSFASVGSGSLAFLAGYSVEILFSTLDRLVGAFARKSQAKNKASK